MLPKAEYDFSDFGRSLIPIIATHGEWGDQNEEQLYKEVLKTTIVI